MITRDIIFKSHYLHLVNFVSSSVITTNSTFSVWETIFPNRSETR